MSAYVVPYVIVVASIYASGQTYECTYVPSATPIGFLVVPSIQYAHVDGIFPSGGVAVLLSADVCSHFDWLAIYAQLYLFLLAN